MNKLLLINFQFELTPEQHAFVTRNDDAFNHFENAMQKLPMVKHIAFGAFFGPYVWFTVEKFDVETLTETFYTLQLELYNYFTSVGACGSLV